MNPMQKRKEYLAWVWEQLPLIDDSDDAECTRQCIDRCYDDGFTKEDALAFTLLTEHVNPRISERIACARMAAIAVKYRLPKGG